MATLKKDCQDRYRLNSFQYDSVRRAYSKQITKNNPMKSPEQRHRMSLNNNNPNVRSLSVDGVSFLSEAEACRYFDTTLYLLRKNYNIQYHIYFQYYSCLLYLLKGNRFKWHKII